MNVQIITQDNRPAFAVIPFLEYEDLLRKAEVNTVKKNDSKIKFPQAVIDLKYDKNCSWIKAWRIHKGKTQKEVARALEMTQGAYSQIENSEKNQKSTLEKIAKVLGLEVEHLTLED